jgi:inner membrane transporter RhtA
MTTTLPRGSVARIPAHVYFVISAVFHYLGPAFAVLLFAKVDVLGVAWLRIASAALIFGSWKRPWRYFAVLDRNTRLLVVALGAVLASMNVCFYISISRLPLGTVGAIEFLGPIALAAAGARTKRNALALVLAVAGVYSLTHVRMGGEPVGYAFAFANCLLFTLYILLGHRLAAQGGAAGIERLGAAMVIAFVLVSPIGLVRAAPALLHPALLAAGIGVGVSSSVIPYICDQLAMARLTRSTYALLLSLLPATASLMGICVLRQIPSGVEILGICLVMAGVGVHKEKCQ